MLLTQQRYDKTIPFALRINDHFLSAHTDQDKVKRAPSEALSGTRPRLVEYRSALPLPPHPLAAVPNNCANELSAAAGQAQSSRGKRYASRLCPVSSVLPARRSR